MTHYSKLEKRKTHVINIDFEGLIGLEVTVNSNSLTLRY